MSNPTTFTKEFGLIMVGAIIFVASFLWKDLLSDVEDRFFPKSYGITGRFVYTAFVTVILVLLAVYIKNKLYLRDRNNVIQFDDSPLDDDEDEVEESNTDSSDFNTDLEVTDTDVPN